jgi:hypothetical protein
MGGLYLVSFRSNLQKVSRPDGRGAIKLGVDEHAEGVICVENL